MCIDFMTASPALSVFNVINYFQLFANCRRRDYNDGNFLETRVPWRFRGIFRTSQRAFLSPKAQRCTWSGKSFSR